ncbi:hypothetical protein CPAR01_11939 [Colletotrichum paranaense]|uniref:Uncharacterized protein n=1 Tax=Colletotrichum paranaense TaxID=1914294 RepID=A0ABQ9S8W0_9PEZI|nr:uncharacterized protein CPAR01_11939 [Colletotrichum paranaense]KAK1529627.1 hypothetical protein CPAR01_11939 [Colletotrichum paranaense]
MSANDENVYALSTAEIEPEAAATLPILDGAAKLPYELVLNIMDYDVLHAESTDSSEITFGLDRDDDIALGRHRFSGIRSFLHTNRKIRSMVLGKFCFMYRLAPDGLNIPNFVFINPKKDSAELKPLLEHMCKVYVGDYNFFTPTNSAKIEVFKHLPGIRLININIGMKEYLERRSKAELAELEMEAGVWSIPADLFPDLAEWAENHRSTSLSVRKPSKKEGSIFWLGKSSGGRPWTIVCCAKRFGFMPLQMTVT